MNMAANSQKQMVFSYDNSIFTVNIGQQLPATSA